MAGDDNFAATFTDPYRNPDVDAAMGFDEQPSDSGAVAFSKGLMSAMYRNSKEGRDLTSALAKQKLLNQLSLQLEERKMQLAQKYEPYKQFFQTPYGSIFGVGQKGATELHSDPDMKAAFQAKQKAEMEENKLKADPEYINALKQTELAKPGLIQAQTQAQQAIPDLRKMQAELAQKRASNVGATKPPKPLTPSQEKAIRDMAISELYPGYKPGDVGPSNREFNSDYKSDKAGLESRIQAKIEEIRSRFQPQQGIASPSDESSEPPDLSGLFNWNTD